MEGTCRMWVGSALPAGLEERAFTAGKHLGLSQAQVPVSPGAGAEGSNGSSSLSVPSAARLLPSLLLQKVSVVFICTAVCLHTLHRVCPPLPHHGDTSIQHPGPGGDLGSRKLGSSRRQLLGPCHLRRCTLRHRRNLLRSPKGAEPITTSFHLLAEKVQMSDLLNCV